MQTHNFLRSARCHEIKIIIAAIITLCVGVTLAAMAMILASPVMHLGLSGPLRVILSVVCMVLCIAFVIFMGAVLNRLISS